MKLHHHAAFSATISLFLYMIFKSWYLSIACLLSGIFIDLDHLIDYFREQGWPFRIKKFFQICDEAQFNRIILFFHGWEWVLLFMAIAWKSGWDPLVTGVAIGFGHHILLDVIYNRAGIRTYSIIWRWSKDFNFDTTFPNLTPVKYHYRKPLDLN